MNHYGYLPLFAVVVLLVLPGSSVASGAHRPTATYPVTFVRTDAYNETIIITVVNDSGTTTNLSVPAFGSATIDLPNGTYSYFCDVGGGGNLFEVTGHPETIPMDCPTLIPSPGLGIIATPLFEVCPSAWWDDIVVVGSPILGFLLEQAPLCLTPVSQSTG